MSITLSALQKQRRDTAANWTSANPTLLAGEIGIESDTDKIKIGDGSTAWTSLAYTEWSQITAYPLVNADIAAAAAIAVSKLADGNARQLLQTNAAGDGVEWASNIDIPGTLDVTNAATFDSNVTIQGDLTVNGTTTTIDTQTLVVEDKNIEIGSVTTPTDVTADGGGITLKGSTDKTINWIDSTDAWTFSEHVNIASGKEYRIAGTSVLNATTLGSGVTGSSLTSVGTLTSGTWSASTIAVDKGGTGQTSYTDGQLLIGNSSGNTLDKATLTAGTGVTITNGNGSIEISATGSGGTVTSVTGTSPIASSGGTTPAISIQDATTGQKGAVQLEDSTSSTSTTTAATPNSVKSAFDLANAALPKTGGALTGDVTLNAQNDLRFADSDSSNWVAFQAPATIASNVTWTLPDADATTSGQVLSSNAAGTLSWVTAAGGGATDKITEGDTEVECVDTGSDGHVKVSTDGTERLRVTNDSYLRLTANCSGIQFGGDTAAVNALNDYEEGTWTPTFTCGTSGTITNTTASNYTKIGDIVHISGAVAIDSVSSPDGSLTIGALPFQAIAQGQAASVSSYFNGSGTPNGAKYYGMVYIVNASTTTITVRKDDPTYDSTVADWVAAGSTFFFSMTYKTSA